MNGKWLTRLQLLIAVACTAIALQQLWNDNLGTGIALGQFSRRSLYLMALVLAEGLLEMVLLGLTWTGWQTRLVALLQSWLKRLPRWLMVAGMLLLLALVPATILSGRVDASLTGLGVRLWMLWIVIRLGALCWSVYSKTQVSLMTITGSGLINGVLLVSLVYLVPALTTSPFSQGWSEASRFYNASLFFSKPIYGVQLPLPTLHPTRYLLQAIAFLVPGATILFHRLWQVLLWLMCNGFTAWALARRLVLPRWQTALVMMWSFLFFFEGPVYYHLVLSAGFVLLGFNRRRPLRSLWVVLGASVWAGLSRINWYPVPGVLAVLLYLLEEPRAEKSIWGYLNWPVVWLSGGLVAALATNGAYIALSGNPPEVFGSALSSPLLWYRLLPNVTYPQGILPASAWVFLPVILLFTLKLVLSRSRWNWLRWLGAMGVLVAFYTAGLVVSVKVGGGSNLHNLDNFIVLLAVVAVYAWMERFTADAVVQPRQVPLLLNGLLLLVAIFPVLQPLEELAPRKIPDHTPAAEQAYLARLQVLLASVVGKGPVLFISDRQLLTFGNLKVDPFEAEYEKVFLMEMAMSGNPEYLGRFVEELQQQRFPVILTEPLHAKLQDVRIHPFSEENNLWVQRVEQPILAYYRMVEGYAGFRLSVYVPK